MRQIINDLYGQGIRRCKMMQSFLTNNVEDARDTLLKHYQTLTIKRQKPNTFRQLVEASPSIIMVGRNAEEKKVATKPKKHACVCVCVCACVRVCTFVCLCCFAGLSLFWLAVVVVDSCAELLNHAVRCLL